MRTPDFYIGGIGAFLPPTVTVQDAVAEGLYPAEDVELHQLGGAAVAGDLPAPEMALRAAQQAVKQFGQPATDFDLMIYASTWHQGPDGWLPHSYLQRHLVGGAVPAVEIRQGCNGIFSAMMLAVSHLRAEPHRRHALLVAADNYGTPMMDRWRMNPGTIAGDAGTAVVLTKDPGFAELLAVSSVTVPEAEELHRGGEPLFPPTATVGRSLSFAGRFQQQVVARSVGMAALAKAQDLMIATVADTVAECGLTFDDLDKVAFMNYSREVVEQRCMMPLGLPMSRSSWDYGRTVGHCGASDHVLSLKHLVETGQLRPGQHMLMLGTGPGINLACALIKIVGTPERA
ncbi:ketoacyl-ACP synthase III family protein [Micromonospora eburnea]|uniref:3-oxoacyl-[acyl-carrier-protein] synthase-3 n=1 Tax=Micromonospora eburnea TaxID=227316 RepID=A0A1C6UZE8_9ACTN|nr:ketoacyl-ACP synthase III family protein [Micromonospora eburnea]SCL59391.1 3-oxoacyl-[acyl-carrier-protein] synthase-3 [Micromonospora eburnea]